MGSAPDGQGDTDSSQGGSVSDQVHDGALQTVDADEAQNDQGGGDSGAGGDDGGGDGE